MNGPYHMTWSSREFAQQKVVDLTEYKALRLADEIYALDLEDWLDCQGEYDTLELWLVEDDSA